jgi:O-antigen/teichoic acid export membrane protein
MERSISLKDAVRFFLPLIFMTELNMISKSVIHAFIARLPAPKTGLAGFSIAFSFYFALTSPNETANLLAISYFRDRNSLLRLYGFFAAMLAIPLCVVGVIALTPFGFWLYSTLFGGSPEVVRQAQFATLILMFSAPVLMLRALAFGLIMLNRRTILITLSTLLRVASLGVSLVLLPAWLEGAAVGAAALVICMAVESLFASAVSLGYFRALPSGESPPPTYREMWGFSWPLFLNQASESGIAVLINVFLGRLTSPDLALAAFGVVHGIANLLMSPLRNLVQTAQTLVRTGSDLQVIFRFTNYLVVIFTAVVLVLFFSPTRGWILDDVMGLTREVSAYCAPAVMLTYLVTVFWAYTALFRGLLAGGRKTGTFAASAVLRVGTVVALGSVTFFIADLNGAVFGVVAWAAAFAAETVILGLRLFFRLPGAEPLFPVYRARLGSGE